MGTFAQALERYDRARTHAFRWRDGLSVQAKVGLALGMAALTGLMAQLRIPLPHTPVPVTGQVFAVLLSGALLGARYGALSQVLYVAIGAAGLPWFNGLRAGSGVLLGVTGGYLLGFAPAALLIGLGADRLKAARRPVGMMLLMLLGVAVIYLCGAIQFYVVMRAAVPGLGLGATLSQAVVPFVGLDVAKALLAADIAAALLPKGPRP